MLTALARYWWVMALRGVAAIVFGAFAFIRPDLVLEVLVLFYGAYLLVDGLFALGAALAGAGRFWALLLEGVAGIAVGVVTFVWPAVTVLVILTVIAVWSILTGILQIFAALQLRLHIAGELWLALSGILSILFGVLLILM